MSKKDDTIAEVIGMKKKKIMAAITLLGTAAVTMTGAYALGCFTTDDSSGYIDLSQVQEEQAKTETQTKRN